MLKLCTSSTIHCPEYDILISLLNFFCLIAAEPLDAYAAFMAAGNSRKDDYSGSGGGRGGRDGRDGRDGSPERSARGGPRGGRYSGEYTPVVSQEVVLGEENEGHKLLKKMGWMEGSGLGAEGGGIVEPIRETLKNDKTGVGSASATGGPGGQGTEYSSYRSQLSSEYHSRTWGS